MKRPSASKKKSNKKPFVPYTRATGVQTKFRKERARYGISVQALTSMARLSQNLTKDGILPDCPDSTGTTFPSLCNWSPGLLAVLQAKASVAPSVQSQGLQAMSPAT